MGWLEGLSRVRGIRLLILPAVLGILLLLRPVNDGRAETCEDPWQPEAYTAALEHRIAQMAEALPGVSEVRVLLTLECGAEEVCAERTGTGFSGGEPLIVRRTAPRVRGAAVVCRGGADPQIQLALVSMLTAALSLPASRVVVCGS